MAKGQLTSSTRTQTVKLVVTGVKTVLCTWPLEYELQESGIFACFALYI